MLATSSQLTPIAQGSGDASGSSVIGTQRQGMAPAGAAMPHMKRGDACMIVLSTGQAFAIRLPYLARARVKDWLMRHFLRGMIYASAACTAPDMLAPSASTAAILRSLATTEESEYDANDGFTFDEQVVYSCNGVLITNGNRGAYRVTTDTRLPMCVVGTEIWTLDADCAEDQAKAAALPCNSIPTPAYMTAAADVFLLAAYDAYLETGPAGRRPPGDDDNNNGEDSDDFYSSDEEDDNMDSILLGVSTVSLCVATRYTGNGQHERFSKPLAGPSLICAWAQPEVMDRLARDAQGDDEVNAEQKAWLRREDVPGFRWAGIWLTRAQLSEARGHRTQAIQLFEGVDAVQHATITEASYLTAEFGATFPTYAGVPRYPKSEKYRYPRLIMSPDVEVDSSSGDEGSVSEYTDSDDVSDDSFSTAPPDAAAELADAASTANVASTAGSDDIYAAVVSVTSQPSDNDDETHADASVEVARKRQRRDE